jgi:hypothetical protein
MVFDSRFLVANLSVQVQLEDPAPSPRWYTEHMCKFYRKGFLPHRHAYLSGVKKDTGYTGYSALRRACSALQYVRGLHMGAFPCVDGFGWSVFLHVSLCVSLPLSRSGSSQQFCPFSVSAPLAWHSNNLKSSSPFLIVTMKFSCVLSLLLVSAASGFAPAGGAFSQRKAFGLGMSDDGSSPAAPTKSAPLASWSPSRRRRLSLPRVFSEVRLGS